MLCPIKTKLKPIKTKSKPPIITTVQCAAVWPVPPPAAAADLAYFQKDKNGLVFDKKLDGVYIIRFTDGTRIVLHDSAAAGWTYQTFAHHTDPKNNVIHGYQSIGDETPAGSMPTAGTATYTGITTSYLVEAGQADRQLTADVKAVADFAKKGLSFETGNPYFHELNNGVRVSTAANGYNMSGSASWAANSNSLQRRSRNRQRPQRRAARQVLRHAGSRNRRHLRFAGRRQTAYRRLRCQTPVNPKPHN